MNSFKKILSTCLIVCMALAGFPMAAQARIVTTDEFTVSPDAAANRTAVNTFLVRDDVRQALMGQGVTPEAALARVAAMTDAEVAQLAGRVEQVPAGGEVLGLMFTVFVILLVTDILGFTKVFPFTRAVR